MPLILEAADPTTTPERLRELFLSQPPDAILRALASNANTPSEVLLQLAARYPSEFLHNPVLPLLYLEDSKFVQRIPYESALRLLQVEDVPVWLLEQFLLGERTVARAARLHVGVAGEAGEDWHLEVEGALRKTINSVSVRMAESTRQGRKSKVLTLDMIPTLPSWLIEPIIIAAVEGGHPLWSRVLADSTDAARTAARRMRRAGSSNDLMHFAPPDLSMPISELEILAKGGVWACTVAARHPSTPPDTLLQLAQDGFPVEENPNASASILQLLAGEEDSRYGVARHPHTDGETLRRLSVDKEGRIRAAVARHPHTPQDVLEGLASDDNSFVRCRVARNPAASPELLAQLAHDTHAAVRCDVARHPHTPTEGRSVLAVDSDGEILDALLRRFDLPTDVRERLVTHRAAVRMRLTWLTKKQILRRFKRGTLLTKELAHLNHPVMRARTARSGKTPANVLQKLARDASPAVRAGVAENKNTPSKTLAKLARDKEPGVREYVAANPHTPLAELRRLSDDRSLEDDIADTVARNPALSSDIIDHLLAKQVTTIDENLVRNPATPPHVLQALASRIESLEDLTPILRHRHANASLKEQVQQKLIHEILWAILQSTTPLDRAAALASSQSSADQLTDGASSTAWLCRLSAARHSATPQGILLNLRCDGNRLVRAAAAAALSEQLPEQLPIQDYQENEGL
jgi:hypothetical protein